MIKDLFYTLKRLMAKSYSETFFKQERLLCDLCSFAMPIEGLEAFTFAPCPKCRNKVFVPLPLGDLLLFLPIGAGGFSSVYKAYHRTMGKTILAVKIIRQEKKNDPEVIKAFLAEGTVHKQIPAHPNIVQYIDSGHEDDEYFYAIEYVEGERLKRRLTQKGKIPEAETLAIVAQVIGALKHIYHNGFLYRDLNAGNIIMRADGVAKLIDFGLTMPIEQAQKENQEDSVWGTSEYIPPERVCHGGEDACSVIYSLGMLMFHMLSGGPYINAESAVGVAKRHVGLVRLAVSSALLPGISEPTIKVVNTMMRQEPAERYQTFEEAEKTIALLPLK
ncbi:MAG: serine/threonine-protein kinase [Kiritimatiellia bacterium]|nr:serine/threonine-protein kinase [Kiritimatiellia bacterium]